MLRILLLGGFRAYDDDRPIARLGTPKVQAFFSFLLLHRSRLWPREVLASTFWPDADCQSARNSLNTTVSRLRGALAPFQEGHSYLVMRPGFLGVDPDHQPWLDTSAFEAAVAEADGCAVDDPDREAALVRADALYGGELLEGFYEDWCVCERERLHRLHVLMLESLMASRERRGEPAAAIALARRILSAEPLREDVHRNVMRLYLRLGLRTEACRHYVDLRRALLRELGVAPMQDTQDLWREISRPLAAPDQDSRRTFEAILRGLDELCDHIAAVIGRGGTDAAGADAKQWSEANDRPTVRFL